MKNINQYFLVFSQGATKYKIITYRSIEQLTEELLSLPSASRALLVEKLVESLEFDIDPAIEAAWVTQAKSRRDEVRNASVKVIDGDEALTQVRRLIE